MKRQYWLLLSVFWALLTLRLTTTPNLVVAPETWFNTILMNGAHFVFFGIQALLLKLSMTTNDYQVTDFFAITLASLFGYYIEHLQRTIPGRSYDPTDWLLDTLGAIIFIYAYTNYRRSRLYRRSHGEVS